MTRLCLGTRAERDLSTPFKFRSWPFWPKDYLLSRTGSELMGSSPCSQLCSFLFIPECGSRCGSCVRLFPHA